MFALSKYINRGQFICLTMRVGIFYAHTLTIRRLSREVAVMAISSPRLETLTTGRRRRFYCLQVKKSNQNGTKFKQPSSGYKRAPYR
jgi:hypothetical protein